MGFDSGKCKGLYHNFGSLVYIGGLYVKKALNSSLIQACGSGAEVLTAIRASDSGMLVLQVGCGKTVSLKEGNID